MFTTLVNIIKYYIDHTVMLFLTPIMKHCTVDGYIFNFCCTIVEYSEVYGIIAVAFLFTTLIVFYRNTIFSVYKKLISFFTNNNSYSNKVLKKLPKILINNTHNLCPKSLGSIAAKCKHIKAVIIKFFKKN